MRAEEVTALYTLLAEREVRVWVDGGWGIDALLAEQTRQHKDFDALVHGRGKGYWVGRASACDTPAQPPCQTAD